MDLVFNDYLTPDISQIRHSISMGVNVEEIESSVFGRNAKKIPHSTHVMNLSGFTNPIYVIDLKQVLTS